MKIHIQQYDSTKNCVRFDSQFGTAEAKWMGDLPDVGSDYYVEIAINKCLDPAVPGQFLWVIPETGKRLGR